MTTSTTTTTTTTVRPIVTEESRTFRTSSEDSAATTVASVYETTPAPTYYQDTTKANLLTDVPTKRGLEEVDPVTTRPTIGSHNSAYEYDDMEGKESIGLANSHVERNLERNEDKVRATDRNDDSATTLESFESNTPTVTEKVEESTQLDENIQARESIGLVQSKVQERFQLFNDNQKVVASEILPNSAEERMEETVVPFVNDNQSESSTKLYSNNAEYSQNGNTETGYQTEMTDSYTDVEAGNTQPMQPVRTQEVRKMSGFLINVTEKKPTERTTLPAETVYPTEYHELQNSSDTSYTSTIPAVTVSNIEEQVTTTSNSIKRVSDTVEESNAPFEVTLTLNGSNSFNGGQGPIGPELLTRLISEHVDEPISLNDVQIVKSDQVTPDASVAQNQQHASNAVSGVRTYQNFRNYHHQPTTSRNYNNHRSQPAVAPNFKNYQSHQVEAENPVSTSTQAPITYVRYQHQPNQNIEFRPYQAKQVAEFHTTTSQQFPPTTTHAPQQNYRNHQNYKDESKGFNNYQPLQEQPKLFKDPILQNVISTTARNNFASEEESLNVKNYHTSHIKAHQNQRNEQSIYKNHHTNNNEPEDYRKYHVNYQTHHSPEIFPVDQKNEQQDFGNYNSKNHVNHQNTNNFNNYQNQQSNDNSQNYENQESNYSDYQNYDSAEDIVESPRFSEFGTRLAAKNPFLNTVNTVDKKPTISEDADAHMINAGLQGKAANFLWAMSQLAKNDRLPRPFTQNSDRSTDNNLSTPNTAYNSNNIIDVHNKARNNNDGNFNKFRQPTVYNNNNNYGINNNYRENKTEATNNYNNNYNGNYNSNIRQNFEDEYIVDVDEFAAPRTQPIPKSIYNQNRNNHLNQKDDSLVTVPSTYTSNNQPTYSRPRQDRILNTKQGPPKTESPPQYVKIPQPNYNAYNVQSTPEVNTVPFNNNQQFVQIPQPDYNEYSIENTQVPQKNIPTLNTPQSQPIDYTLQHSTKPTTESSFVQNENYQIFQNHEPQNLDFNFQHNSRLAPIPPTRVPNKNVQIVNGPHPDSAYNPFLHSTQAPVDDSHKSNENFQTQQNLQQQHQSVDYNFQHSIESSHENSQHNSQSSHENTNVPNQHFQNVNTHPEPVDYNFQHSTESSIEHSQVPNENYENPETTEPQPIDYTFQHPLPTSGHSHDPTQNHQNHQNTGPQSVDYSFPHIQSSDISTPSPYKSIQILTNLHRQQADYNFQHSTQSPVENTRPPNKNVRIQPHSQPRPDDYQFHKDTSSFVGSTPVPDRNPDQPPSIDYSYQHSTPSSAENSYISNESFHSAEGTQPQSGEYNFEQSSELSHEDNQNVRFPDNSPYQPPVDHTYYQSTPSSVEDSQAQHENYRTVPTSVNNYNLHSSTQQSSVESSQPLRTTQPQPIDYSFQPTAPPSGISEETPNQDSRYQNYNVTKTLTKTTVETEFIPSLSFDFGSDQGRKAYLDALEKGLVPNDSLAKDSSASASVEAEKTTKSGEESDRRDRSRKSEESSSSSSRSSDMENFKDTSEPMSGEE